MLEGQQGGSSKRRKAQDANDSAHNVETETLPGSSSGRSNLSSEGGVHVQRTTAV